MSAQKETAPLTAGPAQKSAEDTTDPPKASDLEVHPVAAAFPMLADDELQALAGDIAANGLRQPIVIQGGVLIDGRNRLRACELAGVEPTTLELAADVDPVAFILSANLARRHMSKGQQALALARVEIAAGGWDHGHKSELSSDFGISTRYMAMARTVIDRDLVVGRHAYYADAIAQGDLSLRKAYDLIVIDQSRAFDPAYVFEVAERTFDQIKWAIFLVPEAAPEPPTFRFGREPSAYGRFDPSSREPIKGRELPELEASIKNGLKSIGDLIVEKALMVKSAQEQNAGDPTVVPQLVDAIASFNDIAAHMVTNAKVA